MVYFLSDDRDQLVKNWRKKLHAYDPADAEGDDTDIGLSEFMSNT